MHPGVDSKTLLAFLKTASTKEGLVGLPAVRAAAERFSLSLFEVETFLLENGLCPLRYQRQRQLFKASGQLRLLRSRVGLGGCGGLGGMIFELLVRAGVGSITVVDPDTFSETNLNRQLLCTLDNLGFPKVEAARERARSLNPAVEVIPLAVPFQDPAAGSRLASCELIFDGLDTIPARFELARLCSDADLYLVHGAVAGWCGQVAMIPAAGSRLAELYPSGEVSAAFPETGNLAPTVAAIAALQVAAGLRFLLFGRPLDNAGDNAGDDVGDDAAAAGAFLDLAVPELEAWF
jgi:molybdopterin/thiamine biosynthesis adenylyltransferase